MNFFNKKKTQQEEVEPQVSDPRAAPTAPKKEYSKIVQEIHTDFHSAADQLMIEAEKILIEAGNIDTEKVDRLKSLGFEKADEVREVQPLIIQAQISTRQKENALYYKQHYPLNKFIVESQVEAICEKYGLVCGANHRYKGFVPDKNLKQVEDFKLRKEDEPFAYLCDSDENIMEILLEKDIPYGDFEYKRIKKKDSYFVSTDWFDNKGRLAEEFHFLVEGNDYVKIYGLSDKFPQLYICAPLKEMDTKGLNVEGYKIMKELDPVVMKRVQGGYLILTAWGDEASDPNVVNEINN